jgi:hypothetical protein
VLVAQSGLLSSNASDANQFYVSVSRGRKGVKIYTDDIEALRENVAHTRERPMAMEIMQPNVSERLGEEPEMKIEMPNKPIQREETKEAKSLPVAAKQAEQVPLAKQLGEQPTYNVEAVRKFLSRLHEQAQEPARKSAPKKAPAIAPPVIHKKAPEIEPEQLGLWM